MIYENMKLIPILFRGPKQIKNKESGPAADISMAKK